MLLWFPNGNGILYNEDGTKRIADNTLVTLTLMIVESRTEEKDAMSLSNLPLRIISVGQSGRQRARNTPKNIRDGV